MKSWLGRAVFAVTLLWAMLLHADDGSTLLGGVVNFAPIVIHGFSTWFPGLNIANISYTNSNNTATCFACSGVFNYVAMGNRGRGTGKWYAEFNINVLVGEVGLVNLSFPPSSGQSIGGIQSGVGYFLPTGQLSFEGGIIGTGDSATTGNTIGMAVDLGNKRIWFIVCTPGCGNWNANASANPTTNTGGFDISTLMTCCGVPAGYPLYLATSSDLTTTAQVTLNTGGSAFVNAAPSGFSAWN